jgi:hypothetical protein
MKSRAIIVTVIGVFMFLFAWHAWAQQVSPNQLPVTASQEPTGRYQLFQGHYQARGTQFQEDAVFKLDSSTGKAWIYREGLTGKGEFCHWWESIQDRLEQVCPAKRSQPIRPETNMMPPTAGLHR